MASPVDVVPVFGSHWKFIYWPEKRRALNATARTKSSQRRCAPLLSARWRRLKFTVVAWLRWRRRFGRAKWVPGEAHFPAAGDWRATGADPHQELGRVTQIFGLTFGSKCVGCLF
ncbi:Uncharacterized protein Fot_10043 [Forsythia ovata]|uniref:Uncharacterized protein n=1 Tax=Forsythia ovata TaxID=205694 RepID=A0ABD1WIA3_9LAMI